jgi:hypothetical protein
MKNKKKYISPKITAVELDPEQAILNVCAVGGMYLTGPNSCAFLSGGGMESCGTALRGKQTGTDHGGYSTDQAPS